MTKVGEHITLDIIGTKKEYDHSFYEKLVYKTFRSNNCIKTGVMPSHNSSKFKIG